MFRVLGFEFWIVLARLVSQLMEFGTDLRRGDSDEVVVDVEAGDWVE